MLTNPTIQSQSLLINNLTSPTRNDQLLNSSQTPSNDGDKFELTEDYIQQTIKNALKGGNLTPELQERLMSQLDGSDMADVSRKSRTNSTVSRSAGLSQWE